MFNDQKHLRAIDFFFVSPEHQQIHDRLENWARYVAVKRPGWTASPMFRQYRSQAWQWHMPEIRIEVNSLDGHDMEKAVCALPEPWRGVIRWAYVWKYGELHARRNFGMTQIGLYDALNRGRTMLKNTACT